MLAPSRVKLLRYIVESASVVEAKKAISSKVIDFFEPLLKKHDDYLRDWMTTSANQVRDNIRADYPKPTSSKLRLGNGRTFKENVQWDAWVEEHGFALYKEKLAYYQDLEARLGGSATEKDAAISWYERDSRSGPSSYSARVLGPGKAQRSLPRNINDFVLSYGWDAVHSKAAFEKPLRKEIQQAIVANRVKLTHAIDKKLSGLDIQSVEDMGTESHTQGIEGQFKITLTNGNEGTFSTQSIEAGGWNIQVDHFRYLMKISKELAQAKDQAGPPPGVLAALQAIAPYKSQLVKNLGNSYKLSDAANAALDEIPGAFALLAREKLAFKWQVARRVFDNYLTANGMLALSKL